MWKNVTIAPNSNLATLVLHYRHPIHMGAHLCPSASERAGLEAGGNGGRSGGGRHVERWWNRRCSPYYLMRHSWGDYVMLYSEGGLSFYYCRLTVADVRRIGRTGG